MTISMIRPDLELVSLETFLYQQFLACLSGDNRLATAFGRHILFFSIGR